MNNRNRRSAAFTLLELILTLSLIAMLSLSMYGALNAAFKARASGMRQMAGIGPATIAMDFIEQDLQSVLAPQGTLAGPFVGYAMGSPGREGDSLDFYSIGRDFGANDSPLAEGFRRVQLGIKADAQTNLLVRRVTRNVLAQSVPEPDEEVIAKDILALSITYYDGTSWYEEWDSTLQEDAMPLAVQITVRVADPAPQQPDRTYALTRLISLPCGGASTTDTASTSTPGGG